MSSPNAGEQRTRSVRVIGLIALIAGIVMIVAGAVTSTHSECVEAGISLQNPAATWVPTGSAAGSSLVQGEGEG